MAVFDATFRGTITDAAITALDDDRYIGTLGLLADSPVKADKPHYTGWPEADAGAWLRVVSDTKIGTVEIIDRQNWICLADKTPVDTPEHWTLSQVGEKNCSTRPIYAG